MKTNFTKLGKALEGGLYQVYLSIYHAGKTSYIPTKVLMMESEIRLLKASKGRGDISESLYSKKRIVDKKIDDYFSRNKSPIPIEKLREEFEGTYTKSFDVYLDEYLQYRDMSVKDASTAVYRHYNTFLIKFYKKEYNDVPMRELLTVKSLEQLKSYCFEKGYRNSTIKQMLKYYLYFINWVCFKLDLEPVEYSIKIDEKVGRFFLSAEDVALMMFFKTENSIDKKTGKKTRSDMREYMIWVQDILLLNSYLSLRISEVLSIEKQDVTLKKHNNDQYYEIKFYEIKKDKERVVIVRENFPMKIVAWYLKESKKKELFAVGHYHNFKRALKKLAEQAGLTEPVTLKRWTLGKMKEVTYKKYELVTSHAIRRYAIMKNLRLYGIQVASTFSGHSNWRTLKENYTRELLGDEILDMMDEALKSHDEKNRMPFN